jgi:hypothetical protein
MRMGVIRKHANAQLSHHGGIMLQGSWASSEDCWKPPDGQASGSMSKQYIALRFGSAHTVCVCNYVSKWVEQGEKMHCLRASNCALISAIIWQYIKLAQFLIAPEISCATAGCSSVLLYAFVQEKGNCTDNVHKAVYRIDIWENFIHSLLMFTICILYCQVMEIGRRKVNGEQSAGREEQISIQIEERMA